MDVIGLFISIPIPLPSHRSNLVKFLLRTYRDQLEATLNSTRNVALLISTIRTLAQAVRSGFASELLVSNLMGPYPLLATPPKTQGKDSDKKEIESSRKITIRSVYINYVSNLLKSDTKIRIKVMDSREFIGPILKALSHDAAEVRFH